MKRTANQPITQALTIFAGIYCKVYTVPDAETLLPQHSHRYGHVTAVISGAVRAWRGDECLGDFKAPATIKIHAYASHGFLTLAPATCLMCIHNADHADADGEPVIAGRQLEMED